MTMTVAAVVLWMAQRQNEVAAENTLRMVQGGAAARLDRLSLLVLDYSLWDGAYDAVMAGDEAWMLDNIGTVAMDDGPMDAVVLIGPADSGRFGWDKESDDISRIGAIGASAIDAVLRLLDAEPIDGRAPVATYARSGGEVWMSRRPGSRHGRACPKAQRRTTCRVRSTDWWSVRICCRSSAAPT